MSSIAYDIMPLPPNTCTRPENEILPTEKKMTKHPLKIDVFELHLLLLFIYFLVVLVVLVVKGMMLKGNVATPSSQPTLPNQTKATKWQ